MRYPLEAGYDRDALPSSGPPDSPFYHDRGGASCTPVCASDDRNGLGSLLVRTHPNAESTSYPQRSRLRRNLITIMEYWLRAVGGRRFPQRHEH